jgi:hypothetical protein
LTRQPFRLRVLASPPFVPFQIYPVVGLFTLAPTVVTVMQADPKSTCNEKNLASVSSDEKKGERLNSP